VFFRGRPGVDEEVEILSELIPIAKVIFQPTQQPRTRRLIRNDPKSSGVTVDHAGAVSARGSDPPDRRAHGQAREPRRLGALSPFITRIETARNDPRYGFMFDNANVGGDTRSRRSACCFRLPPNGVADDHHAARGLSRRGGRLGLRPSCCAWPSSSAYGATARSRCSSSARKRIATHRRPFDRLRPDPQGRVAHRQGGPQIRCVPRAHHAASGRARRHHHSQCSTLFAMRMANDRDQAIVRSAVSDARGSLIGLRAFARYARVFAFGERRGAPTRLRFKGAPKHHIRTHKQSRAPQHGFGQGRRRRLSCVGGRALARATMGNQCARARAVTAGRRRSRRHRGDGSQEFTRVRQESSALAPAAAAPRPRFARAHGARILLLPGGGVEAVTVLADTEVATRQASTASPPA